MFIKLIPANMEILKYNILLIGDDLDEFTFITSVLDHFPDVNFHYASTAATGIEMMHMRLPDVVMLDLNMHTVDGMQCLKLLKKDMLLAKIPVIIYSTSVMPQIRHDALANGAIYCIEKPTSLQEIKLAIQKVLSITGHI